MDFNHVRNVTGIYSIKVNKRIYIGSAVNMYQRWHGHISDLKIQRHRNKFMQRVFNKHGECAFTFELIAECNKEDLIVTEQGYIDTVRMFYPKEKVLNLSYVAGSCLGFKHSLETKRKISESSKGRVVSEESRRKRSIAQKGKVLSEETKEKIRTARASQVITDETRAKLSAVGKGRPHSEEHRNKLTTLLRRVAESKAVTRSIVNPDGEIITYTNERQFCRDNGLDQSALGKVQKGKQRAHKGWRRVEEKD